jgi:hypothetical protein
MELTGDDIKEINKRYMNRTTVFMRNSLYGIAVTQEQVEAHTKYLLNVYNNIQDEYIREKQREAAM